MSVTIDNLVTHCRCSRRHRALGAVVDRLARTRLASEIEQFLGPSLSRHPRVVRIRRLHVNVTLPAGELTDDRLAAAWAQALARSLFETLANPFGSAAGQVVVAASPAAFRAAFLRDLVAGQTSGHWEYEEFADLLGLPLAEAVAELLLGEPAIIEATLHALEGLPEWDRAIAVLDDLALERLFTAIAEVQGTGSPAALAIADLHWCARQWSSRGDVLTGATTVRRMALRLYLQARDTERRPPRQTYHALLALVRLLEHPEILDPTFPGARRVGHRLPPPVATLFLELRRSMESYGGAEPARESTALAGLRHLLDELRPLVLAAAPALVPTYPWLRVASASLLLLTAVARRLGWDESRIERSGEPETGPRFFQIVLAGTATAVLARTPPDLRVLEPAAALFAGLERDADLVGMRRTLTAIDRAGRARLLERLIPKSDVEAAASWETAFAALAGRLIDEFTASLRGFRHAPRTAIANQFLRTPGRVQVSERAVIVELDASPYHVALRLGGLDSPVPDVPWMGGRRLEFRLPNM